MTDSFVGPGDWAAIVASAVAVVALVFTWWTTRKQLATAQDLAETARQQADLQRESYQASISPSVWFDIWVDEQSAQILVFRLGNSGAAVARNVVVTIDPPLEPVMRGGGTGRDVQGSLSNGIAYLPPGRVMEWSLGVASAVVKQESVRERRISISGVGPFGPFIVPEAVVRIDDIKYARATPPGTLHGVTLAVDKMTALMTKREERELRDRELVDDEAYEREQAEARAQGEGDGAGQP